MKIMLPTLYFYNSVKVAYGHLTQTTACIMTYIFIYIVYIRTIVSEVVPREV